MLKVMTSLHAAAMSLKNLKGSICTLSAALNLSIVK